MDILVSTITKQLTQTEVHSYHLNVIINKIKKANGYGATNLFHTVNMNQLGYIVFEREECLAFIIQSLRISGITVNYIGNHTLFISWFDEEAGGRRKPIQAPVRISDEMLMTIRRVPTGAKPSIKRPADAIGTITNDAEVRRLALAKIKKSVSFNL